MLKNHLIKRGESNMGCQFSDYYTGKCQLYDGTIEMPVDEDGVCLCEEDEDPSILCEDYREQ